MRPTVLSRPIRLAQDGLLQKGIVRHPFVFARAWPRDSRKTSRYDLLFARHLTNEAADRPSLHASPRGVNFRKNSPSQSNVGSVKSMDPVAKREDSEVTIEPINPKSCDFKSFKSLMDDASESTEDQSQSSPKARGSSSGLPNDEPTLHQSQPPGEHRVVGRSLLDPPSEPAQSPWRRVYIALGSNVGDRLSMIEQACRALQETSDIRLLRTSFLYETAPMYVENQDKFLNAACEITTLHTPLKLLDLLQAIEKSLGRVKTIDKGPRSIDLDILFDEHMTHHHDKRLTMPHPRITEREFVLRPLCDLVPEMGLPSSSQTSTITTYATHTLSEHLKQLRRTNSQGPKMFAVTPLTKTLSLQHQDTLRKTHIMSILNLTPDSFSDGGLHNPVDHAALLSTIKSHIAGGATIIDLGGQSSRPNAPDISADEEICRVLPALHVMRDLPEVQAGQVAISIDTYRAAVARAAVEAGAHIVNDISFGTLDPDMLSTVAELGAPYIGMHMRGTPATMSSKENCTYPKDELGRGGLMTAISEEIGQRIREAESAGIRRWKLILDPGIGFAKTGEQNLEILRRLPELAKPRRHSMTSNAIGESRRITTLNALGAYPWLVGSSRKGFIGKLSGVDNAEDRAFGTAATVAAAVMGGADIVRVHDVEPMRQVVRVSEGIWRSHGI